MALAHNPTVFIIDDHASIRASIRGLLKSEGLWSDVLSRCTVGEGWSVAGSQSVVGCHHCSRFRVSLRGFMLSVRTGREIPSFFIFAIKLGRFSPSPAAAPYDPPIIQP